MKGLFGAHKETPQKESCFSKLGKGAPLHAPTHTFTQSSQVSAALLSCPPFSTLICVSKQKQKQKRQQGSIPHCIKYLLFSAPGPDSPHHRFTYIHILTQ